MHSESLSDPPIDSNVITTIKVQKHTKKIVKILTLFQFQ